ncbi:MAG TPA: hypothetical protein DDX54_05995 [Rhodospirillaceae bacterium]|nr:hypothetical protein [Alphaproteobacteria bacterium]HBH26936.1 hypothetical protein [Rhodospirillaceae bacterium]
MRSPLLVLTLLLLAAPAWAQGGAYTVTGVRVDVQADSAAAAQTKAMGQAQSEAWAQARARLGLTPAPLDPGAVQDIAVEGEHFSATRYTGTFTVRFRPGTFAGAASPPDPTQEGVLEVPPHPGQVLEPPPAPGAAIEATARFTSLGEWAALRRALARLPVTTEVRVLTPAGADLTFLTGDEAALRAALAGVGLALTPEHEIVGAAR